MYLLIGQHGLLSMTELPFHLLRVLENVRLAILGKYDIIYFFNVVSPTIGLSLIIISLLRKLKILKAKIIIDWDDCWGKDGLTDLQEKNIFIKALADWLEKTLPLLADSITVVSEYLKSEALAMGIAPEKIYYLPNGANWQGRCQESKIVLRKKFHLPPKAKILCFAGRILGVLDSLFESLDLVIRKKPEIKVIFIAPLKTEHLKKIKSRGLKENTFCVGIQPYEKLLEYLKASDILLLPRQESVIDKATSPGRLGDFLAAGKPIVAHDVGEVGRIIRNYHCGLLVKPGDAKGFAENILKLLDNSSLANNLGKRSFQVAKEEIPWQIVAERLSKEVFNHLFNRNGKAN